jgi:cytoskeletal protein RodZ
MFQTDSSSGSRRPVSWIFFLIIVPGLIGVVCGLLGGADPTTAPDNNVSAEQSGAASGQSDAAEQGSSPDPTEAAGGAPEVEEPTNTPRAAESTPTATLVVQPTTETGPDPSPSTEAPVVDESGPAEDTTTIAPTTQNVNTAFILDASGSMVADLGGNPD